MKSHLEDLHERLMEDGAFVFFHGYGVSERVERPLMQIAEQAFVTPPIAETSATSWCSASSPASIARPSSPWRRPGTRGALGAGALSINAPSKPALRRRHVVIMDQAHGGGPAPCCTSRNGRKVMLRMLDSQQRVNLSACCGVGRRARSLDRVHSLPTSPCGTCSTT